MRLPAYLAVGLACIAGLAGAPALAQEVNVYSYRQPFLIRPIFDAFTRQSGIEVNVVFAKEGLVERLKREGRNSPADLIFTVDIGRLNDAVEAGVTQPVTTAILEGNIPTNLRHPQGHYYGLTTRVRLIYSSKERVRPGEITTYAQLADPKWKGRICTRSGTHVYQIGLTAAMIAELGKDGARDWLAGVKENLARKPEGNDRAQVKAISEGVCDLSLGNNYYMGLMLQDEEQSAWAESVNLVFPEMPKGGTHVNISGMALTASAPNRENAIKLMEFLAGDLAQQMYAEQNFEYPAKPGVPWAGLLKSWGEFEISQLNLAKIAEYRTAAIKLTNEVGYNE